MDSGPSKQVEAFVALLVPPACREEVLGDLYERYRSRRQYVLDALRVAPRVILSRMRRTADPQLLLIQAFALYVSFLGAAWFQQAALLQEPWGLLRLAIPAVVALLGLMLEDAYATPGTRSPLRLVRGPVLGLALALVSQSVLWSGNPSLVVPLWILFYGCALSLLLSSAVGMWLRPPNDQLQGANAPVAWLKEVEEPARSTPGIIWILKGAAAIVVVLLSGRWIEDTAPHLMPRFVGLGGVAFGLVFIYQRWKQRG